jgi:hypothetical protein
MQQNLKWNDDVNRKISECYATLSVLRKLKYLAPYNIRKQLAASLVLSKLDYNDVVCNPVPDYLLKRLQRMQLAVAGFVLRKYASLGWLPVVERRDYHLAKLGFKAIHSSDWPSYLKLDEYESSRPLRSSSSRRLVVPRVSGTFQGKAARVFSDLPEDIRNSNNFRECCRNCFAHFRDLAMNKISNI